MSEEIRTKVIGVRLRMKFLAALAAAAGSSLVGQAATAFADKGGCPNEASAMGASKANARSAHGVAKQLARGCVEGGEG